MSEFKWHMMAEGMPEKGKKDYLVMGPKGGLYLAPRFEGYGESGDDVWFRDTRGNHHYPDEVLAWAEVPKLEAQGTVHIQIVILHLLSVKVDIGPVIGGRESHRGAVGGIQEELG